ncbi:MAG: hypothetical protein A2359_01165 [Candidatus Moranbacteria bacterium RIFOXYB1_FULL_43_19]|nr:MAG: hypothetical protein A2359_01165 [Candidatus Moranbacteria bacterium RIFOXYB1_FULL_43_19]OGI33022.1 MAG: hypothetical protein A2420_01590 [Candidatus Moranbacteria bacterium RIFOXYC1_FULL_44_13]
MEAKSQFQRRRNMDNIVRFNPEKKCVADSPPAEEAGARESDLVEFNEYAVPSEYKLEHFLIPPADRKWRCGFCGNLGAPHEFSWHQEVWQDDWDTEVYQKRYEEMRPPIKIRCCRDKKCIRGAKKLARRLLREKLRRISLPVPTTFFCPP